MLRLAWVDRQDVVYDLGSGDGRIVITAAKRYGAKGVGVELDTHLISVATRKARDAGVADRVCFLRRDLFRADISSATVVTMFLGPVLHRRLRPTLYRSLRPGARIVAHGWDMGEWEADAQQEIEGGDLFYWIVPAQVAGVWQWRAPDGSAHALLLEQRYQRISGRWVRGADTVRLAAARLAGDSIALRAPRHGALFRFAGRGHGNVL
jgi:SAM-dependent methyltransferase